MLCSNLNGKEILKRYITNSLCCTAETNTWRRHWRPTPVLLPGKSHGRRSPVGCSPWDCEELDATEQLHFHFSLSCIGEGNGNPLQYSCLENPMDGGAWKAAVHGVAEGRERLSNFTFTFHSCIGEGNGNPLQCSCLENPRDGEPGGLPSMGSHRVGHD